MKKPKLNLKEIEITSFITSLKEEKADEIKGGGTFNLCGNTQVVRCSMFTNCGLTEPLFSMEGSCLCGDTLDDIC